ncbi:MAG TPA: hypothetical protein DCO83_08135 [Mucilaginibacter sp.]|jgi:hypothetical protein|nr:hypothetical protein [Mucilaginibacter sp.]
MKSKNQKSTKQKGANEIPEKKKSEEQRPDYPHELEQAQSGGDISYSEEHDVTPPNPHEFPSFGNAETDFVSAGRHGRKTGRMIDHEPGL